MISSGHSLFLSSKSSHKKLHPRHQRPSKHLFPYLKYPKMFSSNVILPKVVSFTEIHPWKLTWNLKITQLERKIIFKTPIKHPFMGSMLPSSKLTWQWKIPSFNRKYIFKGSIFLCYVSLPECNFPGCNLIQQIQTKKNTDVVWPSPSPMDSFWLWFKSISRNVCSQHGVKRVDSSYLCHAWLDVYIYIWICTSISHIMISIISLPSCSPFSSSKNAYFSINHPPPKKKQTTPFETPTFFPHNKNKNIKNTHSPTTRGILASTWLQSMLMPMKAQ